MNQKLLLPPFEVVAKLPTLRQVSLTYLHVRTAELQRNDTPKLQNPNGDCLFVNP